MKVKWRAALAPRVRFGLAVEMVRCLGGLPFAGVEGEASLRTGVEANGGRPSLARLRSRRRGRYCSAIVSVVLRGEDGLGMRLGPREGCDGERCQ